MINQIEDRLEFEKDGNEFECLFNLIGVLMALYFKIKKMEVWKWGEKGDPGQQLKGKCENGLGFIFSCDEISNSTFLAWVYGIKGLAFESLKYGFGFSRIMVYFSDLSYSLLFVMVTPNKREYERLQK